PEFWSQHHHRLPQQSFDVEDEHTPRRVGKNGNKKKPGPSAELAQSSATSPSKGKKARSTYTQDSPSPSLFINKHNPNPNNDDEDGNGPSSNQLMNNRATFDPTPSNAIIASMDQSAKAQFQFKADGGVKADERGNGAGLKRRNDAEDVRTLGADVTRGEEKINRAPWHNPKATAHLSAQQMAGIVSVIGAEGVRRSTPPTRASHTSDPRRARYVPPYHPREMVSGSSPPRGNGGGRPSSLPTTTTTAMVGRAPPVTYGSTPNRSYLQSTPTTIPQIFSSNLDDGGLEDEDSEDEDMDGGAPDDNHSQIQTPGYDCTREQAILEAAERSHREQEER
ncbi:MAG: hypothetical protein Q9169_008748, partial [Polycauliona sp. 2 TL-2023]